MIQNRVAQYIEKEKLFCLNDKVLVTLSGGPTLWHCYVSCYQWGIPAKLLTAISICGIKNRTETKLLCADYAMNQGSLHIEHFDTTQYATKTYFY